MTDELKISTKAEYICVFLFIYLSIDTLLLGTNSNPYAHLMLVALTACTFLILFFRRWIKTGQIIVSRDDFISILILYSLLIASQIKAIIVNDSGFEEQYVYNCLVILFVYELSKVITVDIFCQKYINVMTLIAGIAIILYMADLIGVLPGIPSIIITNTNGFKYHFFGLGAMMEHMKYHAVRAYGIFREPGVFSVYLSIAIALLLFFQKNLALKKLIILSVAVVITFSTAGYIVLALELAIYILIQSKDKHELFIKIIIIIIIALFTILILDKLYELVFRKLFVQNDSLNSRLYSIISGISISFKSPILGSGWSFISNNYENMTFNRYGISNSSFTNTYIRMAATYGYIYTLFMLKKTTQFIISEIKKVKISYSILIPISIFGIWIIMFSNEGMMLNPLLYIWMFKKGHKNDYI